MGPVPRWGESASFKYLKADTSIVAAEDLAYFD